MVFALLCRGFIYRKPLFCLNTDKYNDGNLYGVFVFTDILCLLILFFLKPVFMV